MKIFSVLLLLIVSSLVTAQILEEDELLLSYGDDDFVSIATGRKQAISKAPAVASVITSETIQEVGARDLDEVLELKKTSHIEGPCSCECNHI